MYDQWRKETINMYLQKNMITNNLREKVVLRNKSISDRLNCMSECEEKMLNKVNNARFITKKRNKIFVKNQVKFINNYTAPDNHNTFTDAIKTNMIEELMKINKHRIIVERKNITKSVVYELIDLSIKIGIYRKKYYSGVSKLLWENWIEMFIKGRPLFNTIEDDSLNLLLDSKYVNDNMPQSDEDLKTQAILNRKDVLQYLNGTEIWSEQELGVKSNNLSGPSYLGYLVYDVFTSLNSLPASLIDIENVVFGPIIGVLSGKIEDPLKQKLCNALIKLNILPVLPEKALQYCLQAYYRENDNYDLIQILESGYNGNYDAKITSNSSKKFQDNIKTSKVTGTKKSKQTQTLKIINKYKSERIECGKIVFSYIYNGKSLPNHYLIDCILCYIKENNMNGGSVLIGLLREEIMILEERLAKKHSPPFGSYNFTNNKKFTILVECKGPDLGDDGRYKSSFTSYLKIISHENLIEEKKCWEFDMFKYYKSQNIFTALLLLSSVKNIDLDTQKIELYCSILTGRTVDWSIEMNKWVNHIDNEILNKMMIEIKAPANPEPKKHKKKFKRERLHLKTELDFIDHISYTRSTTKYSFYSSSLGITKPLTIVQPDESTSESESGSSDSEPTQNETIENVPTNHETTKHIPGEPEYEPEIKPTMFNKQLSGNVVGIVLGKFWESLEKQFVDNIEICFFYRRILMYEQEFYKLSINTHFNEILYRQSITKIELVKRLQSDLFNIPENALTIPNITKQLLLAVSDTKFLLKQIINQKIEKCRHFIGNENIDSWLDKQISSVFMIYKYILQTEVDRTTSTMIFVNSYMAKLYNQKIPLGIIPKQLEVSLPKDNKSKAKFGQGISSTEDYYKKFNMIMDIIVTKVKSMFTAISEWIDEVRITDQVEKNTRYLKIWAILVETENLRSANQFKLILARFYKDIKDMDNSFIQYQFNMIRQIEDRMHQELFGIEQICNLFETAINEKQIVRHEIILIDDYFYLNSENILYPNSSPRQPYPLLEQKDDYVITIDDLEPIIIDLLKFCPNRRISLVEFSNWLMNYIKYLPHIQWFNIDTQVLRNVFGLTVNYIDWFDFIIYFLELPYPDINDLLNLKNQYMKLEGKNIKNSQTNDFIEGTLNKIDYDSVILWYQQSLPPNPSICLRFMRIKNLIFRIFSINGKFDYLLMLLAFCKDNISIMGLLKAISLVTDQNIMLDQYDNNLYEKHSINLPMETLYKTLLVCLKNYLAPDKSDIEPLVSLILNTHRDIPKCDDGTFSVLELLKNDGLNSLSQTGFRFTSRHVNNLIKL